MSALDWTLRLARITASSLSTKLGRVMVTLRGLGDTDATAETSANEPLWGTIGILARPRAPSADGAAQVIAAIKEDGLLPIASWDPRLSRARGNVNEGSISLVGYGGSFVGLDYDDATSSDVVTIYRLENGSPKKAHVITLSKDEITILHSYGHYLVLNKLGGIVLVNKAGTSFVQVDDEGIALNGPVKMVTGMLAGDVASAKPVVVSPDGSSAWMAQVTTAIGQIAALLNVAGPVTGAPGTVTPVSATPPTVSTKASASP